MAHTPRTSPSRIISAVKYGFEKKHEPVLHAKAFINRFFRSFMLTVGMIGISLAVGVVGYHLSEGLSWVDSLLNASMILSGMGPVSELHNPDAKVFASLYALFSGLVLVASASVLVVPIFHRVLHTFHSDVN